MKFSFNLKGRQTDEPFTIEKTWLSDQQWDLYSTLLTASLYDFFYEQPADELHRIRQLIRQNDPRFVARLAVYLREQLEMQPLSFILSAELTAQTKDVALLGDLLTRIIKKPDEVPAWLENYAQVHGRKNGKSPSLPTALRKSLTSFFNALDEFRYSRYTNEDQLRLTHALQLVKPKPVDKIRQTLFRKMSAGQIPARTGWNVELESVRAQHYDSTELRHSVLRDKWKEGISSFRIGYMSLLTNLPVILAAGVSGKVLKLAAEYLGNAAAVNSARPSPLLILEVYRKIRSMEQGGVPLLLDALEKAARHSAWSFAGMDNRSTTVVAMDISPSMKHAVGDNKYVQRYDIAPLLALLSGSRQGLVTAGIIGNTWKPAGLSAHKILSTLDQLQIREGEAGYAINAHLVIKDLLRKKQIVEKVMIFTDTRLWNHRAFNQPAGSDLNIAWKQYRQIAPSARLYLFDLAGYGRQPLEFVNDGVFLISGWNDKIFRVLKALDNCSERIEAIGNITIGAM